MGNQNALAHGDLWNDVPMKKTYGQTTRVSLNLYNCKSSRSGSHKPDVMSPGFSLPFQNCVNSQTQRPMAYGKAESP